MKQKEWKEEGNKKMNYWKEKRKLTITEYLLWHVFSLIALHLIGRVTLGKG